MGREAAVAIHQVLVEQFIASFAEPPEELILDFDATTDDRVHGLQEGRFFHGYYDAYCFLPLYVFCGDQLLVSYLRPSKIDGAKHAWAILASLVRLLDRPGQPCGSFCGPTPASAVTACCAGAIYIVGLARNQRLQRLIEADFAKVEQRFQATGEKQRHFIDLRYSAKSWERRRAVCPWRNGEPHQGAATGSVRRSHQRPSVVDQSVPPAVIQSGLCADGNHPSAGIA